MSRFERTSEDMIDGRQIEGSVYVAFRSSPDYNAAAPPIVGLYATLEGAIEALYPGETDQARRFRSQFRESSYASCVWIGPDGFGEVRLMEVNA